MSYVLDDGRTLKNLVGATDNETLEQRMADVVLVAREEITAGHGPKLTFDANHLKALHKHLFQDAFEWAGHFRNEKFQLSDGTIAFDPVIRKEGRANAFSAGNQITLELDDLMSRLKESNYLRGLGRSEFAHEAGRFFAQLNKIHPFREGNGRTQREFMVALAETAGHEIDFSVVSSERMISASIAAAERSDMEPMLRMFDEITNPDCIKALQSVITAIEKFRPRLEPHVSSWDHIYLATAVPMQKYEGKFAGTDGKTFMLQPDSSTILVGNAADLPDPRPPSGSHFSFTASDLTHKNVQ